MDESRSGFRLSLQTKVLLPVALFLALLPAVTVWTVDRHMEATTLEEARNILTTADAVFINSLELRSKSLAEQFRNMVKEPRFKAVSQLGDADTMQAFLRDVLFAEYEDDVEFMVYFPASGNGLAAVRRDASHPVERFIMEASGPSQQALDGTERRGLLLYKDAPYNILSVPVFVSSGAGPVGVLSIGVRLGDKELKEIRSLTHSEVILMIGDRCVGSTLPRPLLEEASRKLTASAGSQAARMERAIISGEHFHYLKGSLDVANLGGQSELSYALLSSYEERLQALGQTRAMLVGFSALGIAVSIGLIWFVLRRLIAPLRALRDGAEAVGRGDFSKRIEACTSDECGALALAFNRMTSNLESSRSELEKTVGNLEETQRQLMQREICLRESEEGLRLMVEGARDHVIFTIDDQQRVVRWNAAATRMLGYSAGEAKGLSYASFFCKDDSVLGLHLDALETARREGRASYEGWRVRKDGTRFWADVTISRIASVSGAEGGGFVEIARDITTRKETEMAMRKAKEAAESSDRAKNEFLANMSHEFRTPMNGIIGMTSLLMNLDLTDEQREYLDTIKVSADSLLAIIDDVLDIAKIEAGELEVRCDPVNLFELLEEVVQLFAHEAGQKGLGLHLVVSEDVPPCIDTDGNRLRQVLVNLVANAVKFTETGGVIVTVRPGEDEERLYIDVKDTGIGIEEDKLDKLFTPFFQVQSSSSRKYGGTGLGLAISRNIANLLGGDLNVQSDWGNGSVFTLSFKAIALDYPSPLAKLDGQRALLVSDDSLCVEAVAAQLSHWGMETHSSRSAPEKVVEAFAEPAPQVVIIDESAARADTLRALLDKRASLGDRFPPMLRLQTRGADEAQRTTSEAGFGSLLVKPVRVGSFNRELRKLLGESRNAGQAVTKLERARKIPEKPPSGTLDATLASQCPLRILVVEDNLINTKVLVNILRKLGYDPDTASNGEEGWKAAERLPYDLVFMDLQMPVMDGLESARRILESSKVDHPIFIAAFTANARQEDRDACAYVGIHDFVAKPARPKTITEVLERAYQFVCSSQAKGSSSA